jgi:alkylation response protein AidB-like acyl-CoA dehydrogenase
MERLHNAAASLGFAQAAFDEALEYTQKRKQFGRDIIDFQAVYHDIADMWASIESARYLVYRAAATAENGTTPLPMDVTLAKYVANKVVYDVSARAVLLQGGMGRRSRVSRSASTGLVGVPGRRRVTTSDAQRHRADAHAGPEIPPAVPGL